MRTRPNTESGFGSLLKWLITLKIEPDQVTAIMEATSVYHENLGYYLYDAGVKVCVANPSRVTSKSLCQRHVHAK